MQSDLYNACENKINGITSTTWAELAQMWDIPSGKILKDRFYRAKARNLYKENNGELKSPQQVQKDDEERLLTLKIEEDGTQVSDRLILMTENDSKSPDFVLNAHGYDPELWVLVNAISNLWNGMRPKDKGLLTLRQSKIIVRPRIETDFKLEDIDLFFEKYKYSPSKSIYEPKGYDKDGVIIEINIADIHVGNEEYKTFHMTIEDRVNYVIDDILKRTGNIKIKSFYLVQLGDISHYDSEGRTTTGGTRITYNGDSNYKIFDRATSILINAVEKLKLVAPVELICIYGNHDRIVSYGISKAVEFYYKNDKYVTVDAGHDTRKFRKFGNNLVFWQHGDMAKKNLKSILYREAREEYGQTLFAEIHCGNWHHQQTLEQDGMIIRYLPSLTSADEWHQLSGYVGSIMSVCSFVWNLETGLRDIWFSNMPK